MTVQELVASLCQNCPTFSHPYEVLRMRADFAVWLVGGVGKTVQRMRRQVEHNRGAGGGGDASPWRRNADGSMERQITSMGDLYSFLGGGGPPAGRQL